MVQRIITSNSLSKQTEEIIAGKLTYFSYSMLGTLGNQVLSKIFSKRQLDRNFALIRNGKELISELSSEANLTRLQLQDFALDPSKLCDESTEQHNAENELKPEKILLYERVI